MAWQEPILTEKSEILREMGELASLIEYCKESGASCDDYIGYYQQHEAELHHLETVEMLDRCYHK